MAHANKPAAAAVSARMAERTRITIGWALGSTQRYSGIAS
jgi:hypothetical protein